MDTPRETLHTPRILLVDDNPTNQKVALALLSRHPYQLEVAENGKQALQALSKIDFDLVLMDCQMPIMDGYEATQRLRAGEYGVLNPRIPIIAMTSGDLDSERKRCLAVGMDDFVSKPIDVQLFIETINRALDSAQSKVKAPLDAPNANDPASPDQADQIACQRAAVLEQFGNDIEVVAVMLGSLLDDAPARMEALRHALATADQTTAHREAHTLKGLARTGAYPKLLASALAVEHLCRDNQLGEAQGHLTAVQVDLDDAMATWKILFKEFAG